MRKLSSTLVAIIIFGASSGTVRAEASLYSDVYFAFGGDKIAEIEVETFDGDRDDVDIDAGEGLGFSFGTRFDFGKSNWDGVIALGYKSRGIFTSEGDDVSFSRFPLTAMVFYDFGPVNLGGGITHEMNGDIDLDDAGLGSADVDNSTGQVIELNWDVARFMTVGARYTAIEYTSKQLVNEFDGDNFAVIVGFRF